MPARRMRGPLLLIASASLSRSPSTSGFTYWAIGYHSQQACTELHILATTKGAITPYDQGIRRAYGRLYALRCR